jgi:acyl-coenzyme A synthetase/AMP-(fatty) acid ligase
LHINWLSSISCLISCRIHVYLFLFYPHVANTKPEEEINKEAVRLVRELVGPVAAFRLVCSVETLPKTRSGKIARKSISDLARNKKVAVRRHRALLTFNFTELH